MLWTLNDVRTAFSAASAYSSDGKVLLEEYCSGREYNLMTWVNGGKVCFISIADREKNPLYGDETPCLNRIVYPAKDYQGIVKAATDVLQQYADAIGQQDGPLSMQFFFKEGQVVVGEIAGRFFGYEHELVTYSSGFNFERLLLDYIYSPENIEERVAGHEPLFTRCCAGLYFLGKEGKTVKDDKELRQLALDADFGHDRGIYRAHLYQPEPLPTVCDPRNDQYGRQT